MDIYTVELGERSYPIYIGEGLLGSGSLIQELIPGKEVCIVTNETIAPLYLERLRESLPGKKIDVVVLPDGEKYKSLETVATIYQILLEKRHSRNTTIIALGGGVVGDMAGFAAATYQRGVRFLQIPTTLLAQVDSSVGGKTGVNHPLGKNMIGAFYQPVAVVADISTLRTLPDREYASGIAEVVKYGLIADRTFYEWLLENTTLLKTREIPILSYAIQRSCQNKALVVAQDERESGIRAILNLGHTFGHAIETAENYQGLLHGEAVAVGMVMAAELSKRLGHLSADEVDSIRQLLLGFGLPVSPSDMTPEAFLQHMALDKKVQDGAIRLVLLEKIGHAYITADYPQKMMEEVINYFCQP